MDISLRFLNFINYNLSTYIFIGVLAFIITIGFYLGQIYYDWDKLRSDTNAFQQNMSNMTSMFTNMFQSFSIGQLTPQAQNVPEVSGNRIEEIHQIEDDDSDDELKQVAATPPPSTPSSSHGPNVSNPFEQIAPGLGPLVDQMKSMMESGPLADQMKSMMGAFGD